MNVLGYARVSTDEQANREYSSIDSQRDLIAKHCQHLTETTGQPHILIDVETDEGYSGKNVNRPGLQRLMTRIEQREASLVVVYRLDRITRSLMDFLHLDARLETRGAAIVSIREQFDTSTPMGRAMRGILLIFAQLERETLVQRITDKYTAMVDSGRWAGGKAPYGFVHVAKGQMVPDPDEAPWVRRMFELYGEGTSSSQIARLLTAEGAPRKQGGRWDAARVRDVLRMPGHRGIQQHGARIGVWPFEVLIEPELAERVWKRLQSNTGKRGPNSIRWEWQRLLKCGLCGARLARRVRSRDKFPYAVCYNTLGYRHLPLDERPGCSLLGVRFDYMDILTEAVLAACSRSQPPPEPEPTPDNRELLQATRTRRERTMLAWIDGLVETSTRDTVLAECERIERQLLPPTPGPVWETYHNLADVWSELPVLERNAALGTIVDCVKVFRNTYEIHLLRTGWTDWPTEPIVLKRIYSRKARFKRERGK